MQGCSFRVLQLLGLRPKHQSPSYFFQSLRGVFGVVLIWRGIWYVLDEIDVALFGGWHLWTAVAGIAAGVLILYIPDRDLDEIRK